MLALGIHLTQHTQNLMIIITENQFKNLQT